MSDLETAYEDEVDAAYVKCPCGFEVSGCNEFTLRYAIENHECSLIEHQPARWYQYAFSFWGWAIIATVAFFIGTLIEEAMS